VNQSLLLELEKAKAGVAVQRIASQPVVS